MHDSLYFPKNCQRQSIFNYRELMYLQQLMSIPPRQLPNQRCRKRVRTSFLHYAFAIWIDKHHPTPSYLLHVFIRSRVEHHLKLLLGPPPTGGASSLISLIFLEKYIRLDSTPATLLSSSYSMAFLGLLYQKPDKEDPRVTAQSLYTTHILVQKRHNIWIPVLPQHTALRHLPASRRLRKV